MIYLVTLPERLETKRLNQAFQAVQQTQETFLSETETQSVTYALIDGEWVLVEDSN